MLIEDKKRRSKIINPWNWINNYCHSDISIKYNAKNMNVEIKNLLTAIPCLSSLTTRSYTPPKARCRYSSYQFWLLTYPILQWYLKHQIMIRNNIVQNQLLTYIPCVISIYVETAIFDFISGTKYTYSSPKLLRNVTVTLWNELRSFEYAILN